MNLLRSVRAVTGASGTGVIDWDAVAEAATAATAPGTLDVPAAEREAYATDVRDARERLRSVADVRFDVPNTIEIQSRHHWITANVDTFRRVMAPLEDTVPAVVPGVSRVTNTGAMATMLAYLARNVLGQYDPLLLADSDEHALYFVRPNIRRVADQLDVDYDRFRRWIAFHEVAHAAEFGAAPWLSEYLESRLETGVAELAAGEVDRGALRELDVTMTAVEGYAELLMDRAFDDDYSDLRRKLDERRRSGGPVGELLRSLLGLRLKRRQYERGAAFFEAVADARGVAFTSRVWERPENLPTEDELDEPRKWISRVE